MNIIFMSTVLGLVLFACIAAVQEFRYRLEDRAWSRKADYTLRSSELPLKSSEKAAGDTTSVVD